MVANDAWPATHWAGYIALALVVLGNAAGKLLLEIGVDKDQSTTIAVRTNTVAHRIPVLLVLPLVILIYSWTLWHSWMSRSASRSGAASH